MTTPDMTCPESEGQALGAAIFAPHRIPELACFLKESHFTGFRRIVWRALQALSAASEPVSILTIHDWLKAHGLDGAACSPGSLENLAQGVISAGHVIHHARRVAAAGNLRTAHARLHTMLGDLENVGAGDGEALREAIGKLAEDVDELLRIAEPTKPFSLRAALARLRVELDSAAPRGLPTGILEIDLEIGGGFHRGTCNLLGGGPGFGKTAFLGEVALHSLRAGRRVLWWSGEMLASEILLRLLANVGGLEYSRLRRGRLGLTEGGEYDLADSELASFEGALEIIEDVPSPLATLHATARRMRASAGLDLVLVDHLGLLAEPRGDAGARHAEVAEASRALKRLAMSLEVPVLCAVQLRRDFLDTEPSLAALAESFAPARDADLVLLGWQADGDRSSLAVKVAKNRSGPAGQRVRIPVDFARMRVGIAAVQQERQRG